MPSAELRPLTKAQLELWAEVKRHHPEPLEIEQRQVRTAKTLMRHGRVSWSPGSRVGGRLAIVLREDPS